MQKSIIAFSDWEYLKEYTINRDGSSIIRTTKQSEAYYHPEEYRLKDLCNFLKGQGHHCYIFVVYIPKNIYPPSK